MSDANLYETDFYAWTQEQAAALRSRRAGANDLDFDNLAEEVEDMGKSELNAARSHVVNILSHLLKLAYSPMRQPANHWRAEIVGWRRDLESRLTPTLRKRVPRELVKLYRDAREIAALQLVDDDSDIATKLPMACPFSWTQIAGREPHWWPPEPGA